MTAEDGYRAVLALADIAAAIRAETEAADCRAILVAMSNIYGSSLDGNIYAGRAEWVAARMKLLAEALELARAALAKEKP